MYSLDSACRNVRVVGARRNKAYADGSDRSNVQQAATMGRYGTNFSRRFNFNSGSMLHHTLATLSSNSLA